MIKLRFFFLNLIFFSVFFVHSQQNNLHKIWNKPDYEPALLAFSLFDIKEKAFVLTFNEKKAMIPASTMKLFTTATALEKWGPNHRFQTLIYYRGEIDKDKKVLNGDLIIKGFGDPTSGSEYFFRAEKINSFVDSVIQICKNNGIFTINGAIIADASTFTDEAVAPATSWEDMANYYASGAYAMPFFDNTYRIFYNSPAVSGQLCSIAKLEPYIPGLNIDNRVLSSKDKEDLAYIFGQPFENEVIIRGTIPTGKTEFVVKGAIPNPNLYYVYYLDSVMNSRLLITKLRPWVSFDLVKNTKYIGRLKSPTLAEIIYKTNKRSLNHFADQLAANLSDLPGQKAGIREGVGFITEFWKTKLMPMDAFFMADGSGLSRQNTLSANNLVFLLNYMHQSPYYFEFANSLPVNGLNGTLLSFGAKIFPTGTIWAKTGSFRGVRSMAGYIRARSGKEYAFALIINNYMGSGSLVKQDMELYLNYIFENY